MAYRSAVTALAESSASRSRVLASSSICKRCLSTEVTPPSPVAVGDSGGPLAKILRDSIKATGPLPVSRYMQFCLSHPTHGYYARGDVFGRKGDFITSPEISQIFGELVAIWLLTRYLAAGSPERCRLIELGPGRGTLMEDVLRTLGTFPAIGSSIKSVHLIDNSEKMREVQSEKLGRRCEEKGIDLTWNDKIDELEASDDFTMLIAHEFFDAMPIDLFEKTQEGFREILVDMDPAHQQNLPTSSANSGLRLAMSKTPTSLSTVLPATSPRFADLPTGTRVEIAHESWKIMRKVGEVIGISSTSSSWGTGTKKGGGAGLIVDYGADRIFGQSFRAFREHKIVDIFDKPGSSDLTANVDFAYLKEALADTGTHALGPIPQSSFLLQLGLQPRLVKLLDSATTPERKEDIRKGAQRLIDPLGMGSQYQVMGISTTLASEQVYPFPNEAQTPNPSSVLKP